MSFDLFRASLIYSAEISFKVCEKSIQFLGIHRRYARDILSSNCVMSIFSGRPVWTRCELARKVFPEDQIQLIEIAARTFDDLRDLEPNE